MSARVSQAEAMRMGWVEYREATGGKLESAGLTYPQIWSKAAEFLDQLQGQGYAQQKIKEAHEKSSGVDRLALMVQEIEIAEFRRAFRERTGTAQFIAPIEQTTLTTNMKTNSESKPQAADETLSVHEQYAALVQAGNSVAAGKFYQENEAALLTGVAPKRDSRSVHDQYEYAALVRSGNSVEAGKYYAANEAALLGLKGANE